MSNVANIEHSFFAASQEFENAWENPRNTRFELPAPDVNKVLSECYEVGKPVHLTGNMVWDMELKKAWNPANYIPYVVSRDHAWGRYSFDDDSEYFVREIEAKAWIIEDAIGPVFEEVFISHKERRMIFLGRDKLTTETGKTIRTNEYQPLFHVEHGVAGTEDAPLNTWRIVILTENNDPLYHQPFEEMVKAGGLPGFLEIYINRDLDAQLSRK
ncbi:hypothetical protein [Colwellia sp. Bg11-28]|uniref:hypothetical protein n=1 Tax=Colwellia sp. Bg11-28 TaxID=2058305 RepID=UPI000C346A9F|nr:hypothetical protein [Colwellia sp. Bg11-28]PKH89130.1 hypothetical protein CXF79_02475 [Colwellia sp. Bg11-28]